MLRQSPETMIFCFDFSIFIIAFITSLLVPNKETLLISTSTIQLWTLSLPLSLSLVCVYFVCWSLEEAMAVGLAKTSEEGQYNAKMTLLVVLSCMVAATGGIIFGYDLGISGPFFLKFYIHHVYNIYIYIYIYKY